MNIVKKYYPILIIFFLAVFATLPLFHTGFFPMHDDEQIARLFDLNQALALGQFPPRLAPNLGFGYGYPFFNFYPSFAYYVGEIFHLLGFGYILSTKLMLFTGFFLSAFFMYLFVKETAGREGGLIAAAAYTFAPYHAVDIYVRGAFAEFFAFVFIPLIFWSVQKLWESKKNIYITTTSISVCFLILSHDLIALMCTPIIGLWLLYLLLTSKDKYKFFIQTSVGFVLGFGASMFFFLPSYVEMGYTLVRILTTELANYNLHFVCIHQLFSSPWGYGGSIPDCNDGLSFEVGKLHLLLSGVAVLLFIAYRFRKKIETKLNVIPIFFVMLAFSMFMSIRESKFIWDAVSPLWFIQFPWRFLELAAFCTAVLSGTIVMFLSSKNKRLITPVLIIVLVLFVVFNISDFMPSKFINVPDNYYINNEMLRWNTSSLAYEYVPGKIATKKSKDNTTQVNISPDEIKKMPYKVVKGSANVVVDKDLTQEKLFEINSDESSTLRISTYDFPGWQVYLDQAKVAHSSNNKLALIDVNVPAGKHALKAVFENTFVRTLGNFVSLISIILICAIGLSSLGRSRK